MDNELEPGAGGAVWARVWLWGKNGQRLSQTLFASQRALTTFRARAFLSEQSPRVPG